jgi:hypothetical protein
VSVLVISRWSKCQHVQAVQRNRNHFAFRFYFYGQQNPPYQEYLLDRSKMAVLESPVFKLNAPARLHFDFTIAVNKFDTLKFLISNKIERSNKSAHLPRQFHTRTRLMFHCGDG